MARCRMLSAGSLPRLSGSFDDGKNRVMIYGPKNVGANIIEFIAQTGGDDRDTQGRRLSAPRTTVRHAVPTVRRFCFCMGLILRFPSIPHPGGSHDGACPLNLLQPSTAGLAGVSCERFLDTAFS